MRKPFWGRCLRSIRSVADQIVIVDTGSTDSTVEVAAASGALIIKGEWRDDFALARNISLQNATGEWILWLDADDFVPQASLELIGKLKKEKPDRVFGFIVRNQRPNNTGTEFMQARMFPNRPDIFFERRIHEQMMPSALRLGMILENKPVVIEHHGYADPEMLKMKAERNVKLLLEEYRIIGSDAVMAVEIGDSYQLIGDYSSAEKWYKEVLSTPDCEKMAPSIAGQAYVGLGNVCNRRELFKPAVEYFRKAIEISPWRTDVYFNMAVALDMNGNTADAVVSLKKVIAAVVKPGQVGVDFRAAKVKSYLRLMRILAEADRLEEALQVSREALSESADRPEIHNMAAKCYLKAGKLMDALHEFEKSILLIREGNIDAYMGLCIIYKIAGAPNKVEECIHSIEPLFENERKYRVFRKHFLGEVSVKIDDFELCLEEIRRSFFYII